jgi:hypothetical protein
LPDPARDQDLRLLAGVQIAAEQDSAAGGRLIAVPLREDFHGGQPNAT